MKIVLQNRDGKQLVIESPEVKDQTVTINVPKDFADLSGWGPPKQCDCGTGRCEISRRPTDPVEMCGRCGAAINLIWGTLPDSWERVVQGRYEKVCQKCFEELWSADRAKDVVFLAVLLTRQETQKCRAEARHPNETWVNCVRTAAVKFAERMVSEAQGEH